MTPLQRLQDWYRARCNGTWEHSFGIHIDTLDNPGWSVTIDLTGTGLETKLFAPVCRDMGDDDWLICRIESKTFKGFGDPGKLEAILETFRIWSESP